MLAVIGLSLACLAIVMFECIRVLKDLPGASSWLNGVARSSTGVIVIMAFFMTGISLVARFALDIETHTFGLFEAAAAVAVVIATVAVLRTVYARRQRALAMVEVPGDDAVIIPLGSAVAPAAVQEGTVVAGGNGVGTSKKNAA